MSEKKIAIASTLKPIDDVRSFHKIGKTLNKQAIFQISAIGPAYNVQNLPHQGILLTPLAPTKRLSLKRFITPWKIAFYLIKNSVDVIIITSHELIVPIMLVKLCRSTKVIYDVQENYFRNLWHQTNYPLLLGRLMALFIRFKEYCSAPFIDSFLLAERCYLDELKFVRNKAIILENRALHAALPNASLMRGQRPFEIVFTGTISKHSGIDLLSNFLTATEQFSDDFNFHIIGQYHSSIVKDKLQELAKFQNVRLTVSSKPIDYTAISKAISEAHCGLVCYDLNPSNKDKMPTKVFEYLAAGLTIIYQQEANWSKVLKDNGIHIGIDFDKIDAHTVIDQCKSINPARKPVDPAPFLWETNEKHLLDRVLNLLSK